NLVILNAEPDRVWGFTFNDDRVPTGKLELRSEMTAHVSACYIDIRICYRPDRGDRSPAVARSTGTGQRPDTKDDLVGFVKSTSSYRHFVPNDFIANTGTA